MRTFLILCLISLGIMSATGCATLARRTLAEAKGADSDANPVPGSGGRNFGSFNGAQIIPPTTNLGGLVSTEFKSQLSAALEEVLIRESKAPLKGGSPTLTVESEIMWYHRGGISTIMPERFAVVLYTLRSEGGEVGRIQVVTKSGAARTDDRELAESSAEELATYLRKHGANKGGSSDDREEDDED